MKRVAIVFVAVLSLACSDSGGNNTGDLGRGDSGGEDLPMTGDIPGSDVIGDNLSGPDEVEEPSHQELAVDLAQTLQALLDEHVLFGADPGAVLTVLTADNHYWSGSSGIAELQTDQPMTADTGFRVGSNTKPFIAVVALQLVDDGLIKLDDELTDYYPEYPQWQGITIRHLLSMRSGIPDYLGSTEFMMGTIEHPGEQYPPQDILAYIADLPLEFEPGDAGQYNNSSYLLLGMIIEQVTGNQVEDEINNRIVEPLELTGTWLDVTGDANEAVARGYMDLSLVGQIFNVPPAVLAFIPEENIYEGTIVDCSYLFDPSITWAAGALIATAPDMVKFFQGLFDGQLLSEATLTEMKSFQEIILLGAPVQYGLGLQFRQSPFGEVIGHGGLNFGYQAGSYYHPGTGITLSHMHNYLPEQSDSLQNAVLDIFANGVDEVPVVCEPPEDIFLEDDGPYLHARFKGIVNAADADPLVPGINYWNLLNDGQTTPLYGWGARARMKMSGFQMRLDVESFSPSTVPGIDLRTTDISLDLSMFTMLDEKGGFELSMDNPAAVVTTVSDLKIDAETGAMELCFTAVSDLNRPSRVFVCDGEDFAPKAGQELKFFAALALETDPAKVEATLAAFQLPLCLCSDALGNWGACED